MASMSKYSEFWNTELLLRESGDKFYSQLVVWLQAGHSFSLILNLFFCKSMADSSGALLSSMSLSDLCLQSCQMESMNCFFSGLGDFERESHKFI